MGTFRFKQFQVCDDACAMKVGTDAVLLGAWCSVAHSKRILEIGTGSGVIGLMLAQRSGPESTIDAVEVRPADCSEAEMNVKNSPWPKKVKVIQSSIQDFRPEKVYDLIVCNPPFFSNSLLPLSPARRAARHDEGLSKEDLALSAARLLAADGVFAVILPVTKGQAFVRIAGLQGLYLRRYTRVRSREQKPLERSLLEFSKEFAMPEIGDLTIHDENNMWTDAYQQLTGEFYLDKERAGSDSHR